MILFFLLHRATDLRLVIRRTTNNASIGFSITKRDSKCIVLAVLSSKSPVKLNFNFIVIMIHCFILFISFYSDVFLFFLFWFEQIN